MMMNKKLSLSAKLHHITELGRCSIGTVWEGVSLCGRAIYLQIFDFMNTNTGACFPSVATIARAAGVTTRCIRRHMRLLESLNVLTITRRKKADGSWDSNSYHFPLLKKYWVETSPPPPPAASKPTKPPEPRQALLPPAPMADPSSDLTVEQLLQYLHQITNKPWEMWRCHLSSLSLADDGTVTLVSSSAFMRDKLEQDSSFLRRALAALTGGKAQRFRILKPPRPLR